MFIKVKFPCGNEDEYEIDAFKWNSKKQMVVIYCEDCEDFHDIKVSNQFAQLLINFKEYEKSISKLKNQATFILEKIELFAGKLALTEYDLSKLSIG
jgi:hypothetical protein